MKKEKDIQIIDGKVYKLKQPLKKQVWFWTTVVCFICSIFWFFIMVIVAMKLTDVEAALQQSGLAYNEKTHWIEWRSGGERINQSSSEDSSSSEYSYSTSSSSSSKSSSASNKTFPFGVSIEFTSGSKLTIKSASEDPSLELYDVPDGYHKVAVEVVVENTTSNPLRFNAQGIDIYDNESLIGDFNAKSYSNNVPNSIAAGMKSEFTVYFVTKNGGPFKVTYGDVFWK